MNEQALLWVWLIGANVLAFGALRNNARKPYVDASYWLWLGVICVWVFGGVAVMAP